MRYIFAFIFVGVFVLIAGIFSNLTGVPVADAIAYLTLGAVAKMVADNL